MRRREFITLLGGASVLPLAARAQQQGQGPALIGWLCLQSRETGGHLLVALKEGLATLVARFSQIEGYKCLSLTRALDVVKCQLALV
jgi:hypothetical protein